MREELRETKDTLRHIRDALEVMAIFAVGCALLALCSSCATTRRQVLYANVADTLIITKGDTVYNTQYVTLTQKEYIDRWRDRIVTVNTQGDTVKEVVTQNVYIEKDSHLRDSIDRYKARLDALEHKVKSDTRQETVKERATLCQRMSEAVLWPAVGGVLLFLVVYGCEWYIKKRKGGE